MIIFVTDVMAREIQPPADRLDDLDRALLGLLQRDAGLPAKRMAELCHTSLATLHRRIRRLKASGAISHTVCVVAEGWLTQQFRVLVEVTLERQDEPSQRAFVTRILGTGAVSVCRMVSGDSDYVLEAQFADQSAFNTFAETALSGDPAIRKYRTTLIMREYRPA